MSSNLMLEMMKKSSAADEYEVSKQLISTWTQRACLASGCTTILISLAKSISLSSSLWSWVWLTFAAFIGYIMSDLGSGIYHWAIDNYGSPKTPIFGSQIESFQVHHHQPWVFTTRQLATKLYIQAIATTVLVMPVNLLCSDPVQLSFMGVFVGCLMFSQQFHAWAHIPKGKLPLLVVALQDVGVVLGRSQHAAHHRSPYNNNYCIVSGVWNRFLDRFWFFVGLELMVFYVVGVRPRSWTDPGGSDWSTQAN